jgi:hypothetical protein
MHLCKTIPIILAISVILIYSNVMAQKSNPRELVDSLWDSEYLALGYYTPFDTISRGSDYGHQYEIMYKGKVILRSRQWPFMDLHNYCYSPNKENVPCFLKDINADGKPELMFSYASGGTDGATDLDIYTIDSSATLIGRFGGLNKTGGWLRDIENDSILEVIFYDNLFLCWHSGCAGSPRPPLIWRWNGREYRLANFRFKDYILGDYHFNSTELKNDISSYVETFSFKKGYDPYPIFLWEAMLQQIYAGNFEVADSIFQNFWPVQISGKDDFYLEFIARLHDGPFWENLLKSDCQD